MTELRSRYFSCICLEARWIPKDQNTKADHLRRIVDPDDWKFKQANEQRNAYFLNYHNISYKMNKPHNWDIQLNSEPQS